jgi:hypothetical protein
MLSLIVKEHNSILRTVEMRKVLSRAGHRINLDKLIFSI